MKFHLWHLVTLVAVVVAGIWMAQQVLAGFYGFGGAVRPAMYAKFQTAQQAFDEASSPEAFLKAAALYQEILDTGLVSGAVLYNQGNAFMRAGHSGRAIACYLQARRYRPRDPYLEANLQYALDQAGGQTFGKPVLEYVLFWQDWISYPGKFQLSTCAALGTLALATAGLFWRRRTLMLLAALALGLTLTASLSAAYDWYRFSYLRHGVVVRDDTVARKGNADSYEPALTQPLSEGTELRMLDRRGDWLLIRLPGGQEGWIREQQAVVY